MMDIDTPRTEQVHALINNCGGSTEAAFHDMLNHARQMERERNEWAERWADLNRAAVRESVALEEAKNVLRIVLNGGIDDGLDWQQVMDKVRDIVKPNPANLARESASVDQHSVVGGPND